MDIEPGLHRAEVVHPSTFIRPQTDDRDGDSVGKAGILGAKEVETVGKENSKLHRRIMCCPIAKNLQTNLKMNCSPAPAEAVLLQTLGSLLSGRRCLSSSS